MQKPPAIGFVALGCAKANVDAERLLSALRAAGYRFVDRPEQADCVIVNTCGFIEEAVEESCAAIEEALRGCEHVIVTGCLGARAEALRKRFPQLAAITRAEDFAATLQAVARIAPPPQALDCAPEPVRRLRLSPRHWAWLKIAEGCNHDCSFCIIPQLRGALRSRPMDAIVEEARALVASGAKEVLLIAQDLAAYGMDLGHRTAFVSGRPMRTDILSLIDALSFVPWLRLHYLYPYPVVDAIVDRMAEGRLLPYLDLPLQHASASVLRRMRRPVAASGDAMLARIERWRKKVPNLVIRSTFIVGFPGETDEDFEALLEFLRAARLDRVGAFVYSPIEGAAANALDDPVPAELAHERLQALMQLQEEISRQKLAQRVGRRERVLVDQRLDAETAIGRSAAEAPEVDGVIAIDDGGALQPGDWAEVEIVDADAHDLAARLVRKWEEG